MPTLDDRSIRPPYQLTNPSGVERGISFRVHVMTVLKNKILIIIHLLRTLVTRKGILIRTVHMNASVPSNTLPAVPCRSRIKYILPWPFGVPPYSNNHKWSSSQACPEHVEAPQT